MKVIVRDWLSANHVLFLSHAGNVLVDTGYGGRIADTLRLLRAPDALGAAPLARIVNTHAHSDHVGGNAALKRAYGCSIAVPSGEAAAIDAWDPRGLLLDFADQRCERFDYDELIEPGSTLALGDSTWRTIAAPGHDMGAAAFFEPGERILISGDALWANGFGFIEPRTDSTACLDAAQATLETIAGLDVKTVVPGHGQPFTEVSKALDRGFARVEQFRRDPERMVWYALKAFFVFALLARGRLPAADLLPYLRGVPVFSEWNRMFLRQTDEALAGRLTTELIMSGAIERRRGDIVPTGAT
jgi:glyoxylase-like metal-dependent hydrolase (beta-lactamase superfamily II)